MTDKPDKCPVCGEEYDEYHAVEEYEKWGLKPAGELITEITNDLHMVEVENRLLTFYVHDGHLELPDTEE